MKKIKSISKIKAPVARGGKGKQAYSNSGNRLFTAAEFSSRQKGFLASLDHDSNVDINSYTQSRLRQISRFLYANVGYVAGVIDELPRYVVGKGFVPQFYGDKSVREIYENDTYNWLNICAIKGGVYNWWNQLKLAIIMALRDGDCLIVMIVKNNQEYFDIIPGHRINDGTDGAGKIKDGPYAGYDLLNGVVFNADGRAIAYRTVGANDSVTWIDERDCIPVFMPSYCDQGRGVPILTSVINDHVDVNDITELEKFAAKIYASQTLIEFNATGTASPGSSFLDDPTDAPTNRPQKFMEEMDGGMIRRYRANSGSDLKAFEQSRPSPNLMAFRRELLRGTYSALGIPIEFAYDMSTLGGGGIRAILGKVQRTVEDHQMMLGRIATRLIGWRVARRIKRGLLPKVVDWYNWDFQLPSRVTIDLGREAQQDREDLKLGLTTYRELCGKRGVDWQENIDQRVDEAAYIQNRCELKGVKIEYVQLLNPNMLQQSPEATNTEDDNADNNKGDKGNNNDE